MNEADDVAELLRRIGDCSYYQFHFRPRRGDDAWKDIALVRTRLGLDIDEPVKIIKGLRSKDCYKSEDSLNPEKPAKKFFFRSNYNGKDNLIITLFMKMASPEINVIEVDSFHESSMPKEVFEEEAEAMDEKKRNQRKWK